MPHDAAQPLHSASCTSDSFPLPSNSEDMDPRVPTETESATTFWHAATKCYIRSIVQLTTFEKTLHEVKKRRETNRSKKTPEEDIWYTQELKKSEMQLELAELDLLCLKEASQQASDSLEIEIKRKREELESERVKSENLEVVYEDPDDTPGPSIDIVYIE